MNSTCEGGQLKPGQIAASRKLSAIEVALDGQTVSAGRRSPSPVVTMEKSPVAKKKAASSGAAATATKNRPQSGSAPARRPSIEEVGHTAGLVWQMLHERGGLTPAELKKAVDAPGDLVLMAVGWLAREGKLDFESSGRTVKILLR